jgi:hypothetical protein
MSIDEALELDSGDRAQLSQQLDSVLQLLESFRKRYPQSFQHLCEEAIATGEMSLGDAIAALSWTTDYLAQ